MHASSVLDLYETQWACMCAILKKKFNKSKKKSHMMQTGTEAHNNIQGYNICVSTGYRSIMAARIKSNLIKAYNMRKYVV